jgi:hypothetical protein
MLVLVALQNALPKIVSEYCLFKKKSYLWSLQVNRNCSLELTTRLFSGEFTQRFQITFI